MKLLKVMFCLCFVAAAVTGCRTTPVDDEELLYGPGVEGDNPLSLRIENGVPITDVSFEPVRFTYDSFQIDSAEIQKIEDVAAYMRGNRGAFLIAEGHCDERGSREYNLSLGEHRALAIRTYLVRLGVEGSRINTRSYGEEMPADTSHSPAAWSRNRRVEFVLYRKK